MQTLSRTYERILDLKLQIELLEEAGIDTSEPKRRLKEAEGRAKRIEEENGLKPNPRS